jgi:hypothetical protein
LNRSSSAFFDRIGFGFCSLPSGLGALVLCCVCCCGSFDWVSSGVGSGWFSGSVAGVSRLGGRPPAGLLLGLRALSVVVAQDGVELVAQCRVGGGLADDPVREVAAGLLVPCRVAHEPVP